MGLLDGQIAATFAAVFGPRYLDGTLYRWSTVSDGMGGGTSGFDDGTAVKVQIDQATQAMQQSEGFVDTDQRILVLAEGVATITTDCEISAGGSRWMIESVGIDPAGSYYELRGRRKSGA